MSDYTTGDRLRLTKYVHPFPKGASVEIVDVVGSKYRVRWEITVDIDADALSPRFEMPASEAPLDVLTYYCTPKQQLICLPYTHKNLHRMAEALGISRHFFAKDHYTLPKRRAADIIAECQELGVREFKRIIKEYTPE